MPIYQTGKVFPYPVPQPPAEGAFFSFLSGGIYEIRVYLNRPTTLELQQFEGGQLYCGLYVERYVPFWVLSWPEIDFSLDASVNFHKANLEGWFNHQNDTLPLYLIDLQDNVLKGVRFIGVDSRLDEQFKIVGVEQLKHYGKREVENEINAIMTRLSIEEMMYSAERVNGTG